MNVALWAIGLLLIAAVLGGFGSLLLKMALSKFKFYKNHKIVFNNFGLWIGLVLYVLASLLGIIAYKGGDLSILFPITSLSYVCGVVLGILILKEKMNSYKWAGILLIVLGVIVIVQ